MNKTTRPFSAIIASIKHSFAMLGDELANIHVRAEEVASLVNELDEAIDSNELQIEKIRNVLGEHDDYSGKKKKIGAKTREISYPFKRTNTLKFHAWNIVREYPGIGSKAIRSKLSTAVRRKISKDSTHSLLSQMLNIDKLLVCKGKRPHMIYYVNDAPSF